MYTYAGFFTCTLGHCYVIHGLVYAGSSVCDPDK